MQGSNHGHVWGKVSLILHHNSGHYGKLFMESNVYVFPVKKYISNVDHKPIHLDSGWSGLDKK